ncbi:MAG: HAD-IIB family hydrolase [Pyrobaculum sp.]
MWSIGLFADYDGTLVPPEETRKAPGPPEAVDAALRELSRYIKFAVVTSKACDFVKTRIPYAHGYGCINGIEIAAGGYVAVAEDLNRELEKLSLVFKQLDVYVEEKWTSTGVLAGVTIDWRDGGKPPVLLERVLAEAESRGLFVLRYGRHPFVDIYASRRNKGDAVRILKSLLGLDYVVYLGDSENDRPAWEVADVKILVRHSYNSHIKTKGLLPIPIEELPAYLQEVLRAVAEASQ